MSKLQRLHCVREAQRKCLWDAQDFLYISAALAGSDIKDWVESALIKQGNFPRCYSATPAEMLQQHTYLQTVQALLCSVTEIRGVSLTVFWFGKLRLRVILKVRISCAKHEVVFEMPLCSVFNHLPVIYFNKTMSALGCFPTWVTGKKECRKSIFTSFWNG